MQQGKLHIRESREIVTAEERHPAGKMYSPDPEAVARMKSILNGSVPKRAMNKQGKRIYISGDELQRLHIERYQKGESCKSIARDYGCEMTTIIRKFKNAGMPVTRNVEDRYWRPKKYLPPIKTIYAAGIDQKDVMDMPKLNINELIETLQTLLKSGANGTVILNVKLELGKGG